MSSTDALRRHRWLAAAEELALESPCLRRRAAAVLVAPTGLGSLNDAVFSAVSGPPDARGPCAVCHMTSMGIPDPTRFDACRGVHAEARVLQAAGPLARGAILYVVALTPDGLYDPDWPCPVCARLATVARVDAIVILTGRGPRLILPEHLVESHERGFHRATDENRLLCRLPWRSPPRPHPPSSSTAAPHWAWATAFAEEGRC